MLIDKNLIQLIQDLHAARADNAALRARLAETEHDRDAFQSLLNDSFETNNDMTEQLAQAEPIIAAVAERHELTVYTAPEETDPRRLALRLCGDCGVMGVPPLKHDDTCLYDKARAYLAARADAEHAQSPVGGTNDGRGNGGNGEFTFANLGEPTADAEPAGEVTDGWMSAECFMDDHANCEDKEVCDCWCHDEEPDELAPQQRDDTEA